MQNLIHMYTIILEKMTYQHHYLAPARGAKKGRGTTSESIDNEGMSSDDIENVLEKETHRVVPVIASDQIPSLTHFVGPNTKSFGFVINSQDHTKGGKHWRAVVCIDRRRAEVCFFDVAIWV